MMVSTFSVLKYWDTSKTINFPLGTNGKLMVSSVLLKHFRVVLNIKL